jgi:uncharacterized protein YcnI
MRKSLLLILAVAALAAAPAAFGHVEPTQSHAAAGSYPVIGFNVPHGCDGSATTQISIQIPGGISYVKPKVKPGWKIVITKGKLPEPVKDFSGNTLTTGVVAVTWRGGKLPDAYLDTFEMMLGMPNKPGKTLYFKTVQRCVKGATRWVQIPVKGQEEPEHPAPAVTLTKSTGGHED